MSSTIQLNPNDQDIKELPHNLEAEQALLGAILLNNDILYDINEIIDSNHFFESIHIKIYEVINKISSKGQLATPITLKSYFEIEKNLEDIGGSAYLARLANAAVSLEYAKNYAQIIYDLAVRSYIQSIIYYYCLFVLKLCFDNRCAESIPSYAIILDEFRNVLLLFCNIQLIFLNLLLFFVP